MARCVGFVELIQRGDAAVNRGGSKVVRLEYADEDFPRTGIVVNNEHANAGPIQPGGHGALGRL